MIRKLLVKLIRIYYNYLNSQYFKYPDIHNSVVFAAEVPGRIEIINPKNIKIGEGTAINAHAHINSDGGVCIGKYVHIGPNLTIYSSNHNFKSNLSIPYDNIMIKKKVNIGDFVWIGANVSIIPGVTIAEGTIIGMGSVVTKDFPPYSIVAGNPAAVIAYRDKDLFIKLKEEKKFF